MRDNDGKDEMRDNDGKDEIFKMIQHSWML
jgi:hypothetical protein